jgi:2-methylisocitrate lyase-like PEP mutase family enzyme
VYAAALSGRGRILLTGRTDNFLNGRPDLYDTIRRLTAFAEVGADVLYAPGLPNMEAINAAVRAVARKPVNVLIGPGVQVSKLDAAGMRRVSLGGALYRRAMGGLVAAAAALRTGDIPTAVRGAVSGRDLVDLLPRQDAD